MSQDDLLKDLVVPFKLKNGLSASIAGLEDPSAATRVAKACKNPDFFGHPAEWLVLTMRIGRSGNVHMLFPCSGVNHRMNYALNLKQTLRRKY